MNILLIGPGSIGKRHLRNILSLGYKNISIVSHSKCDDDVVKNLPVFSSIEEATKSNHFDTAFICTPTAVHIPQLITLLQKQVQFIYIEKPLGNSLDNVNEVLKCVPAYKNKIVVGYDLHFDPGIEKIKQSIQQNIIGKIISVNAFVGQHLPQWRPWQDHRKGMSAKKEAGGGVMLDLIHEVDYLYWLFGKVESVASSYLNTGELEIETEEAAEMLLRFSNGVMGTVHLDYWQPQLKRFCIITGTNGTIHWDYCQCKVTITDMQKQQEEFCYNSFERNDRFITIVKTFLESPDDMRLTSINDAVESLKIILAAKYAAENNSVVKMKEFGRLWNN